ncbi:unnamed protein product [Orchesella dallaii]|uniref:C2H2-type domain-containing protein n=1 Tax=Orchesella dallaii TaxID=48710 RepID=A0ABP1QQT4_9HEXA
MRCEVHGKVSGSCGRTTMQNTVAAIGSTETQMPSDTYSILALDNNQVIGKTYRVQLHSSAKSTVVTSLTTFQMETEANPQFINYEFPMYLEVPADQQEAFIAKITTFLTSSTALIDRYLKQFLEKRLKFIQSSVRQVSSGISDYVSDFDGAVSDLCDSIGLEYSEVTYGESSCTFLDLQCIPENPNSYESIRKILDVIQQRAIRGKRKWITVVSDGLPFSIAQEIIRKYLECDECEAGFADGNDLNVHYSRIHNKVPPPCLQRKYRNILLRPGSNFLDNYAYNIFNSIVT